MASARKSIRHNISYRTEVVEVPINKEEVVVLLTLSRVEASTLMTLLANVGGCRNTSYRRETAAMLAVLEDAGVTRGQTTYDTNYILGSISAKGRHPNDE